MKFFERWRGKREPEAPPENFVEKEQELEKATKERLPEIFDSIDISIMAAERRMRKGKETQYKNETYRQQEERTYRVMKSSAEAVKLFDDVPGQPISFWRQETRTLVQEMAQLLKNNLDSDDLIASDEEFIKRKKPIQDLMRAWQDEHGIKRLGEVGQPFTMAKHDTDEVVVVSPKKLEQMKLQYGIEGDAKEIITEVIRQGYQFEDEERPLRRARVVKTVLPREIAE